MTQGGVSGTLRSCQGEHDRPSGGWSTTSSIAATCAPQSFTRTDRHVLLLCRYVERNALRAGLVERAEQGRWGSLWRRVSGADEQREVLAPWPVDRPRNWVQLVNRPMRESQQQAIRQSVKRGRPYGDAAWQSKMTPMLGLEHTFRNRGSPRKEKE